MRLAFAISVALTGAGQAQDLGPVPVPVQSVRPSQRVIDCYCTDRSGSRVELGETICLTVDGRAFLARCEIGGMRQGNSVAGLRDPLPNPPQIEVGYCRLRHLCTSRQQPTCGGGNGLGMSYAAFARPAFASANAQSSHAVSASTSDFSTVAPHQMRRPGGASR